MTPPPQPKRPRTRVYAVTVIVEARGTDADVRRELLHRFESDSGVIGAGLNIGRSRVLDIGTTRRRSVPAEYSR